MRGKNQLNILKCEQEILNGSYKKYQTGVFKVSPSVTVMKIDESEHIYLYIPMIVSLEQRKRIIPRMNHLLHNFPIYFTPLVLTLNAFPLAPLPPAKFCPMLIFCFRWSFSALTKALIIEMLCVVFQLSIVRKSCMQMACFISVAKGKNQTSSKNNTIYCVQVCQFLLGCICQIGWCLINAILIVRSFVNVCQGS